MRYSPLLTDLYELTMLAGYVAEGIAERPAVFDLFYRNNPFNGGYAVFAGLETALSYLARLRFTERELTYLRSLGLFREEFIGFLRDFRFRGTVTSVAEGMVVFQREPLVTVEGTLAESQFVETALLNIINFQTLVATKAARIKSVAGDAKIIEFGLRRAQGPDGGISVARAAFIGGARSTSNVMGGKLFGIPVKGTHAHSWIMAFHDELAAFRAYADAFPDNCILLVDTYDTLRSGVPNAITVGIELRAKGHELAGIRLDSGDLAWLSKTARKMLGEAGFPNVKIVASNEIDEYVVESVIKEGGRVDVYGVGTKLAACLGEGGGALGGVYKLVRIGDEPKLKTTSDFTKATLPDRKRLWRAIDRQGTFIMDIIGQAEESVSPGQTVYNVVNPLQHTTIPENSRMADLRTTVMDQGKRLQPKESLATLATRCDRELASLPDGCLRFTNPHIYKVSVTQNLNGLRLRLTEQVTSLLQPRW